MPFPKVARFAGVLAVCGALATATSADQLWNQDPTTIICGGGDSSQDARNAGGYGWFSEVADNFPGQAGWTIHEVEFDGGYGLPPGQVGHTHGFTIRFYTDNAGRPGTRVFEQDVMSFTETHYCTWQGVGWAGYHYTVQLGPAFSISAAGQYWVSVVAILDRGGGANEPQWWWTWAATIYPPNAMQWFFSPGNFGSLNNDEAFTLIGTAGPAQCRGDTNCDGTIDFADIDPFVAVLSGGTCCDGTGFNCDVNGDGVVNFADIDPFVALLSSGATCP